MPDLNISGFHDSTKLRSFKTSVEEDGIAVLPFASGATSGWFINNILRAPRELGIGMILPHAVATTVEEKVGAGAGQ